MIAGMIEWLACSPKISPPDDAAAGPGFLFQDCVSCVSNSPEP